MIGENLLNLDGFNSGVRTSVIKRLNTLFM